MTAIASPAVNPANEPCRNSNPGSNAINEEVAVDNATSKTACSPAGH